MLDNKKIPKRYLYQLTGSATDNYKEQKENIHLSLSPDEDYRLRHAIEASLSDILKTLKLPLKP